jgi:ribonuclease P protein component
MDRLTKRADFLAARNGFRVSAGPFQVQARDRKDARAPRVGFTVTKKTGNAVERNRIRRRLREAAKQTMGADARAGFDYVLIARRESISAPFPTLLDNLGRALKRLHKPN